MKRLILMLTLLCLIFSGCSRVESDKVTVVTTIFPPYDFVREIAGDKVDIKMLLKPGGDLHSFEPSPTDIAAVSECDIFIYTGGENDSWVDGILKNAENTSSLAMMDCVDIIEDEHTGHSHEQKADEHVWTSPVNAAKISEGIFKKLCEKDPENEGVYRKNLENYVAKLYELDKEIKSITASAKRNKLIFADPFAMRYFAEEYGLKCHSAFSGCTGEAEADPKTVASLIEEVKAENIPVILYGEFSNQAMADTIADATGAEKMLFHSCHNLSGDDFKSGRTYLDIMYQNASVLKEALN